ncbi:CPBP family intramembrane glutamic endopeptidase [Rubritalea tangerina]|uniref:CPBP family intramembrane glutamic endopeptidase n=1 Tax=Rubritalea tangerina TaxID=430798 RepID=A0ABW4ZE74_9BACT
MTRILQHELVKLFLFILLSFLGAALLAPHLYIWGKNLAAEAAANDLSAPMEWLANKCDRAQFSRYFNRALMACALLLLYPLIKSLRAKGQQQVKPPFSSRIRPGAQGWKDLGTGILFSAGFLTLLVVLLYQLSWVQTAEDFQLAKAIQKALIPAIIVSLLEEWLFRGVLYDVLMRKLNTTQTIIGLSLFFAAVHFLSPPKGQNVADPTHALAGFEMLRLIGLKFLTPQSFFGVFLTLFTVGATLAYTRARTGKLWLAIGLHAGWIFALKFTNKLTNPSGEPPKILYNNSIMDGILPLCTLILTGLALFLYLRPRSQKAKPE